MIYRFVVLAILAHLHLDLTDTTLFGFELWVDYIVMGFVALSSGGGSHE